MLDRMLALLVPGYSLRSLEERKSARLIVPVVTVALITVTTIVFVLSLWSASTVRVTHDQARAYAGILAQVIPVLLLALYVESTAEWGTLRTRRDTESDRYHKLSQAVQANHTENLKILEQIEGIGREHISSETLSTIEHGYSTSMENISSTLQLLESHQRIWAREGVGAAVVALQLFSGLLGEMFALSAILAPRSGLIQAATLELVVLLVLFGVRLFEWPLSVGAGRVGQLLKSVGGAVVSVAGVASVAHVLKITVIG
jgi:hypothetical protein